MKIELIGVVGCPDLADAMVALSSAGQTYDFIDMTGHPALLAEQPEGCSQLDPTNFPQLVVSLDRGVSPKPAAVELVKDDRDVLVLDIRLRCLDGDVGTLVEDDRCNWSVAFYPEALRAAISSGLIHTLIKEI